MAMMICCFCNSEIGDFDELALRINIKNLWSKEDDAASQCVFSHDHCFLEKIHAETPFDPEVLI
jgi:hypothetical protein